MLNKRLRLDENVDRDNYFNKSDFESEVNLYEHELVNSSNNETERQPDVDV